VCSSDLPPEELFPGPSATTRAQAVMARLLAGETATAFQCLREDIEGSMAVLGETGRNAFATGTWFDIYVIPVFESLTRRSGKHGDEKMKKVSGLHGEVLGGEAGA